jgi:hypothetical protein
MKTDYTKLFDFLTSAVFAEGAGDGWVYCKLTNVDEMADAFEQYLKTMKYDGVKRFTAREEKPGTHLFSDMSNENFVFTSDMTQICRDWVTVKIVW